MQIGELSFKAVSPKQNKQARCKYCGKPEHKFASRQGNNTGCGQKLRGSIISDIKLHSWYVGSGSLQAHHLICSEAMDDDNWAEWCLEFGYNINDKLNGVMLPNTMALACQLHIPLHRSNHSNGQAEGAAYPKTVKSKLDPIANDIKSGKYCSNPDALVNELNDLSEFILKKVDQFKWTLTKDGKDYKAGGNGCAGVSSLTDKPVCACPKNRSHGLSKIPGTPLPRSMLPLKIGK
jgi:hypothetical protein